MKNLLAALFLMVTFGGGALAATPEAEPVAQLNTALLATMKAGSSNASFQSRYDALDKVVKQVLNLPVITQNSVGFLWSTVPASQQQELLQVFEQFTVASYVSQFGGYGGQQFKILPDEKTLGAKKIVESQIVPADGSTPTEIDYVMSPDGSGWKATDILLNGTVSQVAVHSSDFSALVTAGNATPLITALKSKVAALMSGTAGN